jgi:polyribonucleotide nucleotidyltransferase
VEKIPVVEPTPPEGLVEAFKDLLNKEELERRILVKVKKEREVALKEYEEQLLNQIAEKLSVTDLEGIKPFVSELYEDAVKKTMRRLIVEKGIRADGRKPTEIRPISCEVGLFPRTHGSALFTRGETQSLGIVTLGAPMDVQIIDTLLEEGVKRFMLHYNFPPFCTGEVKPLRGPSRREIGHGHLAERALKNMLPPEEEFPYTIRVVSEILESNGSSSMATVCSGSLALMDAGVPIKKHVAGIAMGLILEEDAEIILTDIIGMEDHYGDMDFKVAGTRDGITAFQMDCKVSGVSDELLMKALMQAREARMYILDRMYETISAPRPHLSKYAPIIKVTKVDPEKVADVIGPGGRVIKKIIKDFDVKVEIDDETGLVKVVGSSEENVDKAIELIREIAKEIEVGEVLEGKVTRIEPYGLFIEVRPGKIGLLHQSKVGEDMRQFLKKVKVGDTIKVQVINIDDLGRLQFKRVTEGENTQHGKTHSKRN